MLKIIKAIAIMSLIAMAAVAILVFGTFIGTVLIFLGSVFVISVFLYIAWLTYQEYHNE